MQGTTAARPLGRGVEVELILWVRALHAMGEDGHLSGHPRNASAQRRVACHISAIRSRGILVGLAEFGLHAR